MKKILAIILAAGLALGICSCSAAKKPAPPQNQTIIVPEVSRLSFDTVDLKAAPKAVRDMAKIMENQDSVAWARVDNKIYSVISRGEKTKNYDVTVDEVLQRLPEQGFYWIDIKLKYKKKSQPINNEESTFMVVSAAVSNPPNGVSFTTAGLEVAAPAGNGTARQAPQITVQDVQTLSTIEAPAPNQEITSPVKIKGIIKTQGQKRARLSTRGGQILKEESIIVNGSGAFEASMTYSAPEMPTPGEISIIELNGKDNKIVARVPVVIK